MEEDFGLKGDWSFFATTHEKGPVDGMGGLIKRRIYQEVKSRNVVVNSANEFYNSVMKIIPGVKMLFVSRDHISQVKGVWTRGGKKLVY